MRRVPRCSSVQSFNADRTPPPSHLASPGPTTLSQQWAHLVGRGHWVAGNPASRRLDDCEAEGLVLRRIKALECIDCVSQPMKIVEQSIFIPSVSFTHASFLAVLPGPVLPRVTCCSLTKRMTHLFSRSKQQDVGQTLEALFDVAYPRDRCISRKGRKWRWYVLPKFPVGAIYLVNKCQPPRTSIFTSQYGSLIELSLYPTNLTLPSACHCHKRPAREQEREKRLLTLYKRTPLINPRLPYPFSVSGRRPLCLN